MEKQYETPKMTVIELSESIVTLSGTENGEFTPVNPDDIF